eukprot:Phypoly_transcript_18074.p2 GENE.Phypoly_transcript_18074~~Phypoly_transcript_18074.p2  ORF type:complete len:169 (+),score=43.03 Phypoly_transcript_18074:251-757(+)
MQSRVVSLVCLLVVLFSCVLAQTPIQFVGVGTQLILLSTSNNKYVVVDPTTNVLTATGATASDAAIFRVGTDGGDSVSLIYETTSKFVNAGDGTTALVADSTAAGRSQALFFAARITTGDFIITAQINQFLVTVQADNTLIPTTVPSSPATPPAANTLFTALTPPTSA